MRLRLWISLALLSFASSAFGIDRVILISGTTGAFHTDARVLNPSFDKDIVINATFLPTGNIDNSGRTPVSFTVPKRQMRVMNDVTSELFGVTPTPLGAILFRSDDEFEVTSRIYALTSSNYCPVRPEMTGVTLGQFGPGQAPTSAKAKGALLQLRANGVGGQAGTFRTNIGAVNPTAGAVTVTFKLYDKNNAVVASGTRELQPFGVIGPTPLNSDVFFQPQPTGPDLSDTWVSYSTSGDTPVYIYGSVIDNITTDQTFIAAVDDKGVAPPPTLTELSVTLQDFSIIFSPAANNLKVGEQIKLRIDNDGPSAHGFILLAPNGQTLVNVMPAVGTTVERLVTLATEGTYNYACANSSCGVGHTAMVGSFDVGSGSSRDCPPNCY